MALKDVRIEFTTDGSGDSVDYAPISVKGYLIAVFYEYGDAATGADFVLTTDRYSVVDTLFTATNVGTANKIWYPRHLLHNNSTGGALTGTSGGDRVSSVIIGRPKLTTDEGGDTKSGTIILIIEE